MNPRRQFLQSAAAMTATMGMPCSPEAEALAAQATAPVKVEGLAPDAAMPQLKLGRHSVSRLIVGGNPFHGYSHFNRLLSDTMKEWAGREKVCEILADCERNGINTWQFSHHERGMGDLARYREKGGGIQWLLLSHSEIETDFSLLSGVAKLGPLGIAHHGGSAERKRREGKIGQVKDFLKAVRDSGVLVGLSTHDPRFLEQAEDENWDVDYYMTALYHLTRSNEDWKKILGTRPLGEIYLPEDPPKMFGVIRQTKKPCLCYKVLAAGRISDVEKAFRETLANIKPNDGMIVGMWPKHSNQVAENAALVKRIAPGLRA